MNALYRYLPQLWRTGDWIGRCIVISLYSWLVLLIIAALIGNDTFTTIIAVGIPLGTILFLILSFLSPVLVGIVGMEPDGKKILGEIAYILAIQFAIAAYVVFVPISAARGAFPLLLLVFLGMVFFSFVAPGDIVAIAAKRKNLMAVIIIIITAWIMASSAWGPNLWEQTKGKFPKTMERINGLPSAIDSVLAGIALSTEQSKAIAATPTFTSQQLHFVLLANKETPTIWMGPGIAYDVIVKKKCQAVSYQLDGSKVYYDIPVGRSSWQGGKTSASMMVLASQDGTELDFIRVQ